ncbi:MAG: serine dehydratase, partial [Firmicutes bacterium]|nr:serine dehydratase [Bacillota bacterium]
MGGCQAECGSASGMAAAGMVQLLGGTAEQALDAASMALQNVFGLTCDPVAGRVEVPCLGKNILAGSNALAMAELAMAGFDKVIPLDETIAAMYNVGLSLPVELRCTGKGGLSLTPTSIRIGRKLGT